MSFILVQHQLKSLSENTNVKQKPTVGQKIAAIAYWILGLKKQRISSNMKFLCSIQEILYFNLESALRVLSLLLLTAHKQLQLD